MKKLSGFGRYLKSLRIENGLSGNEFADIVGKSQSYISDIENNKYPNITFDFLITCMETFKLEKEERHKFLVLAMASFKELTIPLDRVFIIPKERFFELMAYFLDNYTPPFEPNISWVTNSLLLINNKVTFVKL
jgi:transcriptional regulator with XRE-family HTH domain